MTLFTRKKKNYNSKNNLIPQNINRTIIISTIILDMTLIIVARDQKHTFPQVGFEPLTSANMSDMAL